MIESSIRREAILPRRAPELLSRPIFKKLLIASIVSSMFGTYSSAFAQTETQTNIEDDSPEIEEVFVTGIRRSLETALNEKRAADNLKEVIIAEDIGKLPDQNLAEVLENITGVVLAQTESK